jgi:hypothetical protein
MLKEIKCNPLKSTESVKLMHVSDTSPAHYCDLSTSLNFVVINISLISAFAVVQNCSLVYYI